MPGTHLARWTLSWFASALLMLALALALAIILAPAPGDWRRGAGVGLVHLVVLGWLCQAVIGALIQFLPVLLARPLLWPGLSLAALLLTGPGAVLLAIGFLGLGGWVSGPVLLTLAPALLGLAFLLVMIMAAGAVIGASGWRDSTGRMIILALSGLALVWISGTGMARTLAGQDGAFAFAPSVLPFHVAIGIAAWLGLAAMGVSYRLFTMFLIAPEPKDRLRPTTAVLALTMVVALALGLCLQVLDHPASRLAGLTALLAAIAVTLLYLVDLARLWRSRKRSTPEINMRMTLPATGFLLIAILLTPFALIHGGTLAEAVVFAALIGWLSTLTLAQMIKIVSFLTWIQVFAARIGRAPLPMVHDLVDETAVRRWLLSWLAGTVLATLALLGAQPLPFRAALMILLIALLGLIRELWQIRRLAHIAPDRQPDGLPPLFLPSQTEPLS